MRRILLLFACLLSLQTLIAQDIHYSQFYNSNLNINPALTGIFGADKRFIASYRHQWNSVPVPYVTFSGSYDQKFYKDGNKSSFFSGGALFNYDQAADSRLSLAQLSLSVSWTYLLNKNNLLTIGGQIGGANRSISDDDLQWDNQFNGIMFDPLVSSGENFDRANFLLFNGGLGINYRWQKSKRTNLNLGVAMLNAFSSNSQFLVGRSLNLEPRYTATFQSNFQIANRLDLGLDGLAQFQGEASELVPAANIRYYVNQNRGKEFAIDLGAIARFAPEELDAIAPKIGFLFPRLEVAVSYDINMSDFDIASDRDGGLEIHGIFYITKVKPLNSFKICPIY